MQHTLAPPPLIVQVMECCWAGLVKKVSAAEDLDQVISAHDDFLEQITSQCLLDPDSQVGPSRITRFYSGEYKLH